MTELRFDCDVSDAGKLVPRAPATWLASLSTLRGQPVVVTITKPRKARTVRANAFWWAAIVPVFQEVWSMGRTAAKLPPYTPDETHDVLVQVLVGFEDGPMPGSRLRKRTSEMDAPEFSKLIEAARELALHQYGMQLPMPGERFEVSA